MKIAIQFDLLNKKEKEMRDALSSVGLTSEIPIYLLGEGHTFVLTGTGHSEKSGRLIRPAYNKKAIELIKVGTD